MKIFYALTKNDYENLFNIFLKEKVIKERKNYKGQKKLIFTLATAMFIFPIETIFTNGFSMALIVLTCIVFIYFFLFLAFQFIFKLCEISFKYKLKSKFKKSIDEKFKNSSKISNTLSLNPKDLTLITENETINISYNCLKKLILKENFLIIKYKAYEEIFIPLRAFKDKDEKADFINILKKLSKENKSIPMKAPEISNTKIELQYSINKSDLENILVFLDKKNAILKQPIKKTKAIIIGFQIVCLSICLYLSVGIINELDPTIINPKVTFITFLILLIMAEIYSIKFRVPKVAKSVISKKFNAKIQSFKL